MARPPSQSPRLSVRQGQQLSLSPQLRQAIEILQLPTSELETVLAEALRENPFLMRMPQGPTPSPPRSKRGQGEEDEASDWTERLAERPSMQAVLERDMRLLLKDAQDRAIGQALIGALDPAGYLTEPLPSIALRLGIQSEEIEMILRQMQTLDPPGLFARSLKECLVLQLVARNRYDPAMAALLDHLDDVAARRFDRLRAACGVDDEDLTEMIAELRTLNPKPGLRFDSSPATTRIADLILTETPEGWRVEANPDCLPRILIDRTYLAEVRMRLGADRDARRYVQDRLQAARGLVHALESRITTLVKVGAEIVRWQDAYLRHGPARLKPLTLRMVAEAVGMHESTISRATLHKSIATPRGVLDLKSFFTNAVSADQEASSAAIRVRISALLAEETGANILSDDAIVARLADEGVRLARRTVAKYRDQLGIPGSAERRRRLKWPSRASAAILKNADSLIA